MQTRSPRLLPLLAGTLLTGAAMLMVGCERSDAGASAIREATSKLAQMSDGARMTPAMKPEQRTALFEGVIKKLKDHLNSSSPGVASAANLISARATAALADTHAAEAAAGENQVLHKLSVLRAALSVWTQQNTRAALSEGYNPAADLASIDKEASDIEAAVSAATAQERKAADQLAALQKQADGLLAQAKSKRDQAGQLKTRLAAVSATEGLAVLQQSAAISREADGLEMQAAGVRSDSVRLQPGVDDAKRMIDLLASRRENLKASRATVLARAEAGKAVAIECRKVAAAAAAEAAQIASEVEKERSGPIAQAVEAAAKGFRAAETLAKAKQATSDPAAKSSVASYQQSLGHVLLAQARGMESYIAALKAAVEATPALPNQAELAKDLKAQEEQFAEALKTAREAFTTAKNSFEGSGGKPDAKARIEKLVALLDKVIGKQATLSAEPGEGAKPEDGAEAKPADSPEKKPQGGPDGAAVGSPEDIAGIRKTAGDLSAALKAGDVDRALGFFNAQTDDQNKMLESLVAPLFSIIGLDVACKDKLGAGLAECTQGSPMSMMVAGLLKPADALRNLKTDDMQLAFESATKATWTNEPGAGSGPPTAFVKMGGRWLMEAPSAQEMAAMGPAAAMIKDLGDVCTQLTGDVKGGKFKSKEEFSAAFMAKMMPMIQKMMPSGAPKPGGG